MSHAHILSDTFGFIGVGLFFALSGFLITCLLMEEWARFRAISLRKFYARRALRLLPALSAMLVVFLIYAAIVDSPGVFHHDLGEVLTSFFYSTNWALALQLLDMDFLRNTWSLSIEEQFYFIWPAVLLILLRRSSPASMPNLVLLVALLSWGTRIVLFAGTTADSTRLACGLDTHADALLVGCVAAMVASLNLLPPSRWTANALRWGSAVSVIVLAVMGFTFSIGHTVMYYLGWFLISLCASVIILQLVTAPGTISRRVLENPGLVYVGKISYGLYLWNWPVFRAVQQADWPLWKTDLLAMSITMLFTLASYYLLEQPCLRLKKRFQNVQ
jgi:peptidoglycan/LPS O-acetylase OafA/YrhL